MVEDKNALFRDITDKKASCGAIIFLLCLFVKGFFKKFFKLIFSKLYNITVDPDQNWAKILDLDPNSMCLDPQPLFALVPVPCTGTSEN